MAINFPHRSEIRLNSPPLIEVVCQVRFPAILKIAKEEPSDFQEVVRERFPQIELEQGVRVEFPGPGILDKPSTRLQPRIYHFRTINEQTAISLTADFFALSTYQYTHWGDFSEGLAFTNDAMQQIYRPAYATRIGLRYINRLNFDNTGSQTTEELLGLLRLETTAMLQGEVWQDADSLLCQLAFSQEEAILNVRLAKETGDDGLPAFLLDFDYFERGKLKLDDLVDRCERYHRIIYDVFRWCLLDESLVRFNPIYQ
jgi:uncharacterized protein (TIGR04255 family)